MMCVQQRVLDAHQPGTPVPRPVALSAPLNPGSPASSAPLV